MPDVDTVLFLRPTESSTIFMQQLGRGLRRTQRKAVLTVLDFVGYHRKEFSFSRKFAVLTGIHGKQLEKAVKEDFHSCRRVARCAWTSRLKRSCSRTSSPRSRATWTQIVAQLRTTRDDSLESFLESSGLELSDVLRQGSRSWTKLRQDAGLDTLPGSELEEKLLKRVRAFAHVDDPQRAAAYRSLLADGSPPYDELSPQEQRNSARCSTTPSGTTEAVLESISQGFDAMRHEAAARAEVASVVDLSFEAARHVPVALTGSLVDVPLQVHARYQREEILAALDFPRTAQQLPRRRLVLRWAKR